MNKRIFDLTRDDISVITRKELVQCIEGSEGRTLMVENVVSMMPPIDLVTGAEMAAAFGADMITLNCLDVFNPQVLVLGAENHGGSGSVTIADLKHLTGRLIGCNLEPVADEIKNVPAGRCVSKESVKAAISLGVNYIVLTGNPGMHVSQELVVKAIKTVREVSQNVVIIAGKMHGGGIGNDYNLDIIPRFAQAGADVMMFPAPYTTPGVTPEIAHQMMSRVHQSGMLGMLAIGTSQEGANGSYIEQVAMASKAAGADIVHIGDGGFSGIAIPENIMTMGLTIRGRRHQFKRMANRR